MSGTRLLSRKVPAIRQAVLPTLLIAAHGERGGARDDRFAHLLASRLRQSANYHEVHVCFISKTPTLKEVYSAVPGGPVEIYPLFMSDGYFVKQAIPDSVNQGGARDVTVLEPVGLSSGLPGLLAGAAADTATAAGISAADCQLLLVAHGSKHGAASRKAAQSVAASPDLAGGFAGITLGFLEEPPFLDDQLAQIGGPAIAAGLFVGAGMHAAEDLPEAIEKSGRDDILVAPQLAYWPGIFDLIGSELAQ